MDTETTRALVHRLYAAYAAGDGDAIAAMVHDEIDWIIFIPIEVFPFGGPRRGKEAVLEALAQVVQDYEIKRYEPETIVADGDRAAALSSVAFVQRSTGRTLSFRIADFMRFQDGKMIEFREFSDTFDVTQQALGRWLEV